MESKKIIVVGSANMDLIMRVARLPKPGESLTGKQFMTAHGGKGANQAVAAARLGASVTFVGVVGDDSFGALQREGFIHEGISLDHLKTTTKVPTGAALILLTDSGQNAIMVAPGANYELLPADIAALRATITQADVVITQLEIPLETMDATLRLAQEVQCFSILDVGQARAVAPETLARASIVSPNETEAEALTGIAVTSIDTARSAARKLRDMGVAQVVMKLGAHGCLYYGAEELHVPAFAVTAVDTTAAGDAFTAALGVAWEQMSLDEALRFANAAGALAATVEGAQPSMPHLNAVNQFLAKA